MVQSRIDSLPPNCPEAERGVLGCCLLDMTKAAAALKAGVTRRWFYDSRHAELFKVLSTMALNGGGDFVTATIALRQQEKLESIGGVAYLMELQGSAPSAENLGYYIPEVLRNLPQTAPFVVKWDWPLFRRETSLDPSRLKQAGGRPARYDQETHLECLGDQRLTTSEWEEICALKKGVSHGRFYQLLKALQPAKNSTNPSSTENWSEFRASPITQNHENNQ